jgi:CDP-diacylglycerol--glycerol-3-phosphate 3-phosphatidyltransferase
MSERVGVPPRTDGSARSDDTTGFAWARRLPALSRVPNYLTLFRIASIPLVIWLLLWDWHFSNQTAGLVFAAAGFSDVLDGLIARRYGTTSQLGVFFDLVGDKLLVAAVLFTMVELDWMPGWVALGLVGRELFVMGLRAYAGAQGVTVPAGKLGKWKMIWQYAALGALMWERSDLAWVLVIIALTLTLVSGIHYAVHITRMLRVRPAPGVPDVV